MMNRQFVSKDTFIKILVILLVLGPGIILDVSKCIYNILIIMILNNVHAKYKLRRTQCSYA